MTTFTAARTTLQPKRAVLTSLVHMFNVRSQRQSLRKLDADALRDLGLTPTQAQTEAKRPFWDAPSTWTC